MDTRKYNLAFGAVGLFVAIFTVAMLSRDNDARPLTTPIEEAVETCKEGTMPYIVVGDDGRTLTIDGDNEYGEGAAMSDVWCVLEALDVSDAVVHRMERTRALDGTQEGTWGDLTASWTYHPDEGLDVLIEVES